MSADYRLLLDATIAHLERLRVNGAAHVPVRPATLAALTSKAGPARAIPSGNSQIGPRAAVAPPAPRPTPSRPAAEPESFASAFESAATAPRPVAPFPASPAFQPPTPKPLPPRLDPAAKAIAFAALEKEVLACQRCPRLVAARHSVVFGVGDPNARILFVGEAPGADEDLAGQPFVGAAGELLTRILTAMGLNRQTVYIANILKCRPDMPAGASGNRKPSPEEMAACSPWLQAQIDLIQPEAMVALGNTALEGLFGGSAGISRMRGKWLSYRGIPLMPTFHPAYLLRNQVISEKRKVWEDMMAVMTKLNIPISDRQRSYFATS